MKKLSVSLLALIAIAFAVTSAFTTMPEKIKATTTYVANPSQVDPPNYSLDVTTGVNGMPGPSQAEKELQFLQAHCVQNDVITCFARFKDGSIEISWVGKYQ